LQIQPTPQDKERLGAAGAALGLGCSIVVSVVLFIVGGVLVDKATDLTPVFTLLGLALALVAAGYQLYEMARVGRADVQPGPLTRQIARVASRSGLKVGHHEVREDEE
jgi:hypothetical protein